MTNDPHDDAIEALLRRQFAGAVPDDGFCERVMRRLPPRRRRRTWPVWVGMLAGGALCGASLLPLPLLRAGWQDWLHGDWSVSAIALLSAIACMSLLALGWAWAELHDR